jgi:anthranilate synthase component 1
MYRRIFSDQLTPVLAYRCLVKENDVNAPSFLLESVVNGDQTGRYSFLGAMPALEVVAKGNKVTVLDHTHGTRVVSQVPDPLQVRPAAAAPSPAAAGPQSH